MPTYRCLAICFTFTLSGCQSSSYLWQAMQGQWQLINQRQPISELVESDSTPQALSNKLRYVLEVRRFAASELHLPVGQAYSHYVDLQRPYVVWNLFVAPELEMKSHTWCYPVAGCIAYQGYFEQARAEEARQQWQSRAYDTYVGDISAYSTLGWFDDPVLSTFIRYDTVELAALLFHELAHRQLYIQDDTTFNESWATAVEQAAVETFIRHLQTDPRFQVSLHDIERYQRRFRERSVFVELVQSTVTQLEQLYNSPLEDSLKRERKQQIFDELRQRYREAVAAGQISNVYASWINSPMNNAKLLTVSSYHRWVPGLRYQLEIMGNDFAAFYAWSAELEDKTKEDRRRILEKLNLLAEANLPAHHF